MIEYRKRSYRLASAATVMVGIALTATMVAGLVTSDAEPEWIIMSGLAVWLLTGWMRELLFALRATRSGQAALQVTDGKVCGFGLTGDWPVEATSFRVIAPGAAPRVALVGPHGHEAVLDATGWDVGCGPQALHRAVRALGLTPSSSAAKS